MSASGVIVVTGANRGLGAELVSMLRERGLPVLATERNASAERALALDDRASISSFADTHRRAGTRIATLVNNAAIYTGPRRAVLHVNVMGTLSLTEALAPLLADHASVVMVSSGMGELSGANAELQARLRDPALTRAQLVALLEPDNDNTPTGWPDNPYSTSKLALNTLTRILAREPLAPGVRTNAVCPGWCRTDMGGANAPRSATEGARSILAAVLDTTRNGTFSRDGREIAW